VLDRNIVEQIAADLGTRPGLIEKDWHVVRAIGVLEYHLERGATPDAASSAAELSD
jgi:hypothetical protein